MTIEHPDDPGLDELCEKLSEAAEETDRLCQWPREQLGWCGEAGVFEWFLPRELGGQGWSDADVIRGYLKLSAACLTTTFILTQRTGACRRIAASENEALKEQWLPSLLRGDRFATVGISHLTTSRRHLGRPAMLATKMEHGFLVEGESPWVTGAKHADVIVMGATLEDDRQILFALPTSRKGIEIPAPVRLVGLSASDTGPARLQNVFIEQNLVLAGPVENVMSQGAGAKTGGLETSCLAVGLASRAVTHLEAEASKRADLKEAARALRQEQESLERDLLEVAQGASTCTPADIRARSNSLVLRATQAALAAAKGTGYALGHPAGRWCREALFFLVWSCPQPVMNANLCELAGLGAAD